MLNIYLTILTIYMISITGAQQRTPITAEDPCKSSDLCIGKNDPLIYHAYAADDSKYYACVQLVMPDASVVPLNIGCQQCAARDTFYSPDCKRCLSRQDVDTKNCSDPVTPPRQQTNSSAPTNFTSCSPIDFCVSKPNATFQLPRDHSMFFSCVNEKATECQKCPASLIYVEVCGKCEVNDTQVASECPVVPTNKAPLNICADRNFCNNKADGDYEASPKSNQYHKCTEGTCIVDSCPAGTSFASICDSTCVSQYTSIKSECPGSQPIEKPTVLDTCSPSDFCKDKPNGNYQITSGVKERQFYSCGFTTCNVFNCQPGLVYRPDMDYCDHPSNF